MTREDLAERQQAHDRDLRRRLRPRAMAAILVAAVLPLGVALVIAGNDGPKWAGGTLGLIGFLGVMGTACWADIRVKGLHRAHRLECPHCGRQLTGLAGRTALATGRCGGCGGEVVTDPTGEPDPADPAARRARDRRLVRLTLVGCALGLLAAWGVLIPLKLTGPMPPHLTWPVVVLHPLTGFGFLAGIVVLPILYPRRALAWILGVCVATLAVLVLMGALFIPGFFDLSGPGRQP